MIERPHTQMPVWQKTMQLIHLLYTISSTFPEAEREGLGRKIKNRATDIPVYMASALSNGIHSGSGAALRQASDALAEVETLLYVAFRVSILRQNEFEQMQEELMHINQDLAAVITRVNKKTKP